MPTPIKRVIKMLVPRVDADGNELGGIHPGEGSFEVARSCEPGSRGHASPLPAKSMIAYPVSRRVYSPKNDAAKPIEPEPA